MLRSLVPYLICPLFLLISLILSEDAFAWSPHAHTFIAQKAGIAKPAYSNFADLVREENKELPGSFHYHNAAPNTTVTKVYIDRFPIREEEYVPADRKGAAPIKIRVPHPAGVLYWKIVEVCETMKGKSDWEYAYYTIMIAHYIGDLSQPLHNIVHGDKRAGDGRIYPAFGAWAKENRKAFDDVLESVFPLYQKADDRFNTRIVPVSIHSSDDLKREIARIANVSIALANRCYAEKRFLTVDEALKQRALSVSLLRAMIADTKRTF